MNSTLKRFIPAGNLSQWPDLSDVPSDHEEHTKILYSILEKTTTCINALQASSKQEEQTLQYFTAFTQYIAVYCNYTGQIMDSGKTLATRGDIENMMAEVQRSMEALVGDRQSYNWQDDIPDMN